MINIKCAKNAKNLHILTFLTPQEGVSIIRHGCCEQINATAIGQFQFFLQFLNGSREIPDRQVGLLHSCQQVLESLLAEVATSYDAEAASGEILYQLVGGEQVAEGMQLLHLIYITESILHTSLQYRGIRLI